MNKLKINFFGTGIEIKKILLPNEVIVKWRELNIQQRTFTEALIDPFFYYKLKHKKYNSLEDLPVEKYCGIINSPKSNIEFWFNRRKVYKVNTLEIFNENVLFPLFNLEKSPVSFAETKGIFILQYEIGTIATYELMVNSKTLNIDDFIFEIDSCLTDTFIKNITYQNQKLNFIKKDTVITYQTGCEVPKLLV